MNEHDTDMIFGRNSVREAMRSGREIDVVYVQENAEKNLSEIISLARKKGIPVKQVPKNKLDQMLRFNDPSGNINHQGIAVRVARVEYASIEDAERLAEEKGEPLFLIALDGIEDPRNLGAIVRSAEIFGAHGVIITKRKSAGMTGLAAKTASGAEEYIPVIKVSNLATTIDEIKKKGVFVAAADMGGQSLDKTDLTGAMMLVIGSEGEGISRLVRDKADFIVSIDMYGHVESLNASVAAAILMYEKKRQDRRK
ncbi:MAG: 23S rRNA (guanosine(2251)-2'-O)-methyltransferase RlmB [Clostridia bacterium]|nr:23S rRNA (guanosine(2251)-2'-O)-methyltransferase RlmB [Clostridia bacterium]